MKVILTIGSPYSGYQAVASLLTQAGVASTQASNKSGLTPQTLQAQLLRSHEVDLHANTPLAQVQPGKLWSELATDLFLTNMQHPNWGWADSQSAVLMDFWHDFDSQVRLLLVYNSPANCLAQVLSQTTQPTAQTVNAALDEWARWNTALLRYLHRHPDYCLLVNSQQATEQAQLFLPAVAAHWQLSGLHASAMSPSSQPDYQHLQAHLINQLIDPLHPAWALQQELEGAALLTGESDTDIKTQATPSASDAWADWSRVRSNLVQLADENVKLIATSADAVSAQKQLGTQLIIEAKAKTELLAQRDQLVKENALLTQARDALLAEKPQLDQLAQASAEAAGLKQENELLLLQLHQVQEELESHFLQNQALSPLVGEVDQLKKDLANTQVQRDALSKAKVDLVSTRDTQVKLLQDRQHQLESAQKIQDTAQKTQAQNIKLITELQTSIAALQTQKDQLSKEKSALSHAQVALQAEKAQLAQQLDQQKVQLSQAAPVGTEVTEFKQENELLLLQLHQVQEELEHYFLSYQELEKNHNTKATSFVTDFWRMHQPQELLISMQHDIAGGNWYPAESDGRWAGPATLSTLQMPPVQPGNYTLELHIVDAMNLGIVTELVVETLGQTLPAEVFYPLYKGEYPLICKVSLNISQAAAQQAWQVNLRFPQTVCPGDRGSDDHRHLALRLRAVKLVKQS
ncbi:hypothetical protein [Rhodoferax sp. PAMC 29310]|uniref:hypothetical protein n=1 Tax=Rhodoferax sp. PAMC 29310 TaxID=2822760 RepID=UPI001B33BAB5|nr:hypothetical protein [Rhodoferax sp. PAMC 29310]